MKVVRWAGGGGFSIPVVSGEICKPKATFNMRWQAAKPVGFASFLYLSCSLREACAVCEREPRCSDRL